MTGKDRLKPFQLPAFLFRYLLGELEREAVGGTHPRPLSFAEAQFG